MNNSNTIMFPTASNVAGWSRNWVNTAFFAIWLAFATPWLFGGQTIPWDGKAHFAPQVQFMAASFARGEWPWWTPNVFAGHPQIADPQSMLFSPPFVLLALFNSSPGHLAIDATVFVCLLLSGFGILWLTRDLGWHPIGGLIAAIAFAFGAAMAWRLQHFGQVLSLAYLPFTLLFLRRAILGAQAISQTTSNAEPAAALTDHTEPDLSLRLWSGIFAGLTAAFIALGRDQVGLLCLYLLSAYAIALLCSDGNPLSRVAKAWAPLSLGAVTAATIVTAPILLTMALADQSNRPDIAYQDAAAGSLHPALLITGFVPHLFGAAGEMAAYWGPPSFHWENTGLYLAQNMGLIYIGALPAILIISGMLRGHLWSRDIRFFSIALLAITVYALGWYTPLFERMHALLPGVSFYRRPADAVFLIGALAALLAGFSADRMLRDWSHQPETNVARSRTTAITCAIIAAAFALALTFAVLFDKFGPARMPIALALAWFALTAAALLAANWLAPIRATLAGTLLIAVLSADIIVNNGPNGASALPRQQLDMMEPDAPNPTIAALKTKLGATRSPTRRDRIEMVGLGYHWPNTALTHNLHSTLGANPVRLENYVAATGAGDTVAQGGQRAFPPAFPTYNSPLANLLGLRYIVTGAPIEQIDQALQANTMPLAARTAKAYIYENPKALPRAILATNARRVDFAAIIKSGNWPNIDFRTTVLLDAAHSTAASLQSPSTATQQPAPKSITIESYRNTEIILHVNSANGGWAVLHDVWHPWWYAEVDGRPVPILRANLIFRAIPVPAGNHTVRLIFRPIAGAIEQAFSRPTPATSAKAR